MKPITTEHIVMACILGMFIRDMVIEFKPKSRDRWLNKVQVPLSGSNQAHENIQDDYEGLNP